MDDPANISRSLTEALRQTVSEKRRFFAARAAVSAGVLCLLLAAAVVVTDIVVAFGPMGRWTSFLLLTAALGCMLLARYLLPSLHYREHAAVRDIESACPSVGQLIRTSADVAHHGEGRGFSPALSQALLKDAAQAVGGVPRERLVPWHRVRTLGAICACIAAAFLLTAVFWPDFRKATVRLALPAAPVTFTHVDLGLSSEQFERGESIAVDVAVSGRPSDSIRLSVRPLEGDWRSQPLVQVSQNRWASTVSGWTESFELKASAGDDRTGPVRVTFVDPPKVLDASVTLTYPAYTRLPPKTMPLRRIVAVEGTTADLQFQLNHALKEARVDERSGHTERLRTGLPKLTHHMEITPGARHYVLRGTDEKDIPLKPFRWQVKGLPDQVPILTFVTPKEDVTVTKLAELPIDLLVEDDLGLAEAEIILTIDGDEYPLATLRPEAQVVRQTHLEHYLKLEDFPVYPGCNMRIHARARDQNPARQGWAVSDIRLIQIRPLKILQKPPEEEPQTETASAEELQQQLATLDEAIQQQKQVLEETLRRREEMPRADAPMQREAQTEQDLAQTMQDLLAQAQPQPMAAEQNRQNQALAQPENAQPQTEPLHKATQELQQAAEQLMQPDIPQAYRHEDLAMAEMMKARQSLQEQLEQATEQQKPGQQTPQQQQQQQQESLESLAERAAELARQERQIAQQTQQPPQNQAEQNTSQPQNQQQNAAQQMAQAQQQNDTPAQQDAQQDSPAQQAQTEGQAQQAQTGQEQQAQAQGQAQQDTQQSQQQTPQMTAARQSPSQAATEAPAQQQQNQQQNAASPADPHQLQQQAVAEAAELEADVATHPQTTPLAEQRTREAREAMEQALASLADADQAAAASDLQQAEKQLDELAHHLRGLDPAMAAETLERAARLAQEAAEQLQNEQTQQQQQQAQAQPSRQQQAQQNTPQNQNAPQQAAGQMPPQTAQPPEAAPPEVDNREQIARNAETMDDWMQQLAEAPVPGMETTQQELQNLREHVQTDRLAEQVRRAETERQMGRTEEAQRQDQDSAQRFNQLAEAFDRERNRLVRSRLEQLAAAEQEAQRLQQESRQPQPQTQQNQQGQTTAEQLRDFADELQALRDSELEQRAEEIREQVGPQNITGGPQQGNMIPENVHRDTLPGAEGRLRDLIDDIVRREMLVDRDARVPESYQPLVENYFQALSDDQQVED